MVSDKTVGMVIGFGLGFASAYILIKTGTITVSMDKTATQKKYGTMNKDKPEPNPLAASNILQGWRSLDNIPTVDKLEEFKPIPVNNIVEPLELAPGTVHYKNSEKWKIIRDKNNRIVGYELDRNAKVG